MKPREGVREADEAADILTDGGWDPAEKERVEWDAGADEGPEPLQPAEDPIVEMGGEIYRVFDCPGCGFSICEWTDCPECGWYDKNVWEATLEGGESDPGAPEIRLREAIKQLTIARQDLSFDDVVHPALDEAEVLVRGVADRLEEEAEEEVAREEVRDEVAAEADSVEALLDEAAGGEEA